MTIGSKFGVKNAGFRALRSLMCENGIKVNKTVINLPFLFYKEVILQGHHTWGSDLRSDDTPIEANLHEICRKNGNYRGSLIIDNQRAHGVYKRLVYLTIDEMMPLWGLEGVYRNGECVGHLRMGEFGYGINKSIGKAYIACPKGTRIDDQYLSNGEYEIDVLGKRYKAKLHLTHS